MDGAVTEFFSLEESPAPAPGGEAALLRDHYGFMVPPDYHELYRVYSPVWEQEETEREAQWCQFLSELAHLHSDGGKFASLEELCANYLQEGVTIALAEPAGSLLHRPKLDALVKGGVPFTIRGTVWTIFLDIAVRKHRNYYNELVKLCLGDLQYRGTLELDEIRMQAAHAAEALQDAATLHALPGYRADTEKDLETWRANSKVWLTQIEKDLPRTFPGLKLMEVSGRPALRRVLAAYSLHNSRVGYCQGLNFVAGTLLLFLDEEDAFWCLCALLEDILSGYYDVDMMAMQVDQRVFKRLVSEHFPQLSSHLEGLGADVSCVFVQWFLCVFVNFLPIEACLRVWDALFYYRSPTVLFKTALALLEVFSPALSCCGDVLEALDLLQTMAPLTYDSNRLMDLALGPDFEAVTDVRLATLRREYREEVLAEAAALADELAWEGSTSSANARSVGPDSNLGGGASQVAASASSSSLHSQPLQPQASQAAQQQPRGMSVLKMLARGMKEKFAGVGGSGGSSTGAAAAAALINGSGGGLAGGGSGSGANSVERAASPAPPDAGPSPLVGLASVGLGAVPGNGLGGGGGGGAATAAAASGRAAAGGGADEPLLVRSSHALDGHGVEIDSEDYHPLTGDEAFQYEQVGYVAPSEPSDSTSNAFVVGKDDRNGRTGVAASAAAAAVAPQPPAAAATPSPPPAPAVARPVDPLEALLASPGALDGDDDGRLPDIRIRRNASSSYMWHETPKWTSVRSCSITATGAPAAAAAWAARYGGAHPAPPPSIESTPATPDTAGAVHAAGAADTTTALSPRVLLLAAGGPHALHHHQQQRQSSMEQQPLGTVPGSYPGAECKGVTAAGAVATANGDGAAMGGAVLAPTHPMHFHAAASPQAASAAPEPHPEPHPNATLLAAVPPPPHAAAAGTAAAAAAPQSSNGAPMIQQGATAAADFSQVQAADQARRAQGKSATRRCSRAAVMAWEIALEPLRARQIAAAERAAGCARTAHGVHPQAQSGETVPGGLSRQAEASQPRLNHLPLASALAQHQDQHGKTLLGQHQHQLGALSGQTAAASAAANPGSIPTELPQGPLGLGVLQPDATPSPSQHPPALGYPHAAAAGHPPPQQLQPMLPPAAASHPMSQGKALAGLPHPHPPGPAAAGPHAATTGMEPNGASLASVASLSAASSTSSSMLVSPTGYEGPLRPALGSSGTPAAAAAGNGAVAELHRPAGAQAGPVAAHGGPGGGAERRHPVPGSSPATAIPMAASRSAAGRGHALGSGVVTGAGGAALVAGAGCSGLGHPPLGTSVASTGSVMLVDEHREASPAEARDEWVIMSAPSGDRELAATTRGTGGSPNTTATSTAASSGNPPRQAGFTLASHHSDVLPGPTSVRRAGGPGSVDTPGMVNGSSIMARSHTDVPVGAAGGRGRPPAPAPLPSHGDGGVGGNGFLDSDRDSGGVAAMWQSPGDLAPSAVAELRDALGISDLLLHHSALAQRLRSYQGQQQQPMDRQMEPHADDGAEEGMTPAELGSSEDPAAAASPATPPPASRTQAAAAAARASQLPLPPLGWGAGSCRDPIGLAAPLERLSQLQQLLDGLAAEAEAAEPPASSATAASSSAAASAPAAAPAAASSSPTTSLSSLTAASIAAAGGGTGAAAAATAAASSAAAAALLPDGPLPLPLSTPAPPPLTPVFPPLGQVVVGPGGQIMLQPPPPPPPPPTATAEAFALTAPAATGTHAQSQPTKPQAGAAAGGSLIDENSPQEDDEADPDNQARSQPEPQSSEGQLPHQPKGQQPLPMSRSQSAGQVAALAADPRLQLQRAGALCSALRADLGASQRRGGEAGDLLEQFGVLSEVLAARLDELVRQLAEKQYTVDKLSSKLDQTMQKYAAQDTALADKDYAIRHLQHQLQGVTGGSLGGAAGGGAAGGGGGGGAISGLSSALGFGGIGALGGGSASHGTAATAGGSSGTGAANGGAGAPGGGRGVQGGGPGQYHGAGGAGSHGGAGGGSGGGSVGMRHNSPARAANAGLLWQFSKNLKAKFGSRDDTTEG